VLHFARAVARRKLKKRHKKQLKPSYAKGKERLKKLLHS
jgi:hypothetical protein